MLAAADLQGKIAQNGPVAQQHGQVGEIDEELFGRRHGWVMMTRYCHGVPGVAPSLNPGTAEMEFNHRLHGYHGWAEVFDPLICADGM